MSMSSIIAAEDDQATPASLSATYGTPQGAVVTPMSALSPLPPPQLVVVALDATRDHHDMEIRMATRGLLFARGDILRRGDSLLVLGVLTHPSRFHQIVRLLSGNICSPGLNPNKTLEDQVVKVADFYQNKLLRDVEELRKYGITVTLKISPGSPAKDVIMEEVNPSKAAWVVVDRHFRRDFGHLQNHIACKIAVFEDSLSVKYLKAIRTCPSNKSTGVVKAMQHLAVKRDLSYSKAQDEDATAIF